MSYFSEEMERQLAAKQLTGHRLSELTGLSSTQIYNWLRNVQTSVSAAQLTDLAPALSDDVLDHAALVRAHLLDEKQGPGADLVYVEIESPRQTKDRPRARSKAERAMEYLAIERHKNPELNELIIGLAKMLGAQI